MSDNSAPTNAQAIPEVSPNELERLRDILFGQQSRSTDKRLQDLDSRLETARQAITAQFTEHTNSVADTAASQLAETRRSLSDRLDKQNTDQSAQLRAVQKDLSDRIDTLAADLLRQIRDTHKDLSDRLDKLSADQTERVRATQAEARQRDEALRQEFLNLAASLSDKKTSRADLGQMLIELGQRLRSNANGE